MKSVQKITKFANVKYIHISFINSLIKKYNLKIDSSKKLRDYVELDYVLDLINKAVADKKIRFVKVAEVSKALDIIAQHVNALARKEKVLSINLDVRYVNIYEVEDFQRSKISKLEERLANLKKLTK